MILNVYTVGCGWERWSNKIKCGNMESLGVGGVKEEIKFLVLS